MPIELDLKTFTYEDYLMHNPKIIAEESPEDTRNKSQLSKASSGKFEKFNLESAKKSFNNTIDYFRHMRLISGI